MEFFISEKFRLEVHWDKVNYLNDMEVILEGCYFCGPVLSEVVEIQQEDFIRLDFINQYVVFVNHYYIANLSWEGARRTEDKIFLDNVVLKNKYLNSVPKLENDDYIVIDTINHENEKHSYNLVYISYLINKDGEHYNFRSE